MISDPFAMEHTVIDPATEAIQIIGRFRNPIEKEDEPEITVKKDIYHITNYNTELTNYSNEEIDAILTDIYCMHRSIAGFIPASNPKYINKFKSNILKLDGFSYFNWNSSRNYFMTDNFKDKESIKGYYNTKYELLRKYRAMERFDVDTVSEFKSYALTDSDLREMTTYTAISKINVFVGQRVKEIMAEIDVEYRDFNLGMLRATYRKQMSIIDGFGLIKAAKLDYDITRILEAQAKVKSDQDLRAIKAYVNETFGLRDYPSEEIKALLKAGVEKTGLVTLKPTLRLLKKFAKVSKRKPVKKADGTKGKGYEIICFYE